MLPALQYFADSLPNRPCCTNDPHMGQTVRGRTEALKFCNIQPNTSGKVVWLAFDVDHTDGATAWHRLSAPPPTLAVENPRNGHAHLLYALQVPVPRTEAARARPLLYLAAAQEGIRRKLEADPGYSGHLCKNPLHPRWQTQQWAQTYTLAELADWVDLPRIADMKKRVRDPDYAGLGRNCELFERLRPMAYSLVRKFWSPGGFEHFKDALRALADDLNADFAVPLPMAEVRGIASSCACWVWKHFDPATFRKIQSIRGARKGAAKRDALMPEVLRLIGEGKSQREVAAAVGVSHMTVCNWLKG
ncbi:replication initiation protein [Diaphorobacter sp.]|uniref:replication initiation protein n=1 Tax=Diaphorobacter sp. TaxID=1934310 RepID=UPI003D10701B